MDRKEQFWTAYAAALSDDVAKHPQDFALAAGETPESYAAKVAPKMRRAVEKPEFAPSLPDFGRINYRNSRAFKQAAKAVGVPFNVGGLNSIYTLP